MCGAMTNSAMSLIGFRGERVSIAQGLRRLNSTRSGRLSSVGSAVGPYYPAGEGAEWVDLPVLALRSVSVILAFGRHIVNEVFAARVWRQSSILLS